MLLPLEFLYCLNYNFNSFGIFIEKEGLYRKVDDIANAADLVLRGVLGRDALL